MLRTAASLLLKPRGRQRFIQSLPRNARLLDIGCGNNSPEKIKNQRPDIFYVGVDVGDYNINAESKSLADKYILTTGENFASTIRNLDYTFDAAISAHNLEHCNHPMETLDAICLRLRIGGGDIFSFSQREHR